MSKKCTEAAQLCLSDENALVSKWFHWEVAQLAYNGLRFNPNNTECCDILIDLFTKERQESEENKACYSSEDEKAVLLHLVEKDQKIFPEFEKWMKKFGHELRK